MTLVINLEVQDTVPVILDMPKSMYEKLSIVAKQEDVTTEQLSLYIIDCILPGLRINNTEKENNNETKKA